MVGDRMNISPQGGTSDTIISYCLGILSAVFIILSVIKSLITQGDVERIYAVLMLSAILMTFTGTLFGVIGYHSEEGNLTIKKVPIIVNGVLLAVSAIFLIKGFH